MDLLDAGEGVDTLIYTGDINTTANLSHASRQNTGHGFDKIVDFKALVTLGNNTVTSGRWAHVITGVTGSDSIISNGGGDTIYGGAGKTF